MGLEVICGCMYSGKTEELIRRVRRALFAKQQVRVFKPFQDTRYSKNDIVTHYGEKIEGYSVENAAQIYDLAKDTPVIGIDEAQFFSQEVLEVVELLSKTKRVIVCGLDQDFAGRPFGHMGDLLCMAESITKLTAVCTVCGEDATRSQRTSQDKNQIKVGSYGDYEARCSTHWECGL